MYIITCNNVKKKSKLILRKHLSISKALSVRKLTI